MQSELLQVVHVFQIGRENILRFNENFLCTVYAKCKSPFHFKKTLSAEFLGSEKSTIILCNCLQHFDHGCPE